MGPRPRTTERTLALSDGVFAIALTLLVFSIHLPHLAAGHEHELAAALLDHRDELLSWLVSFGVIGFLWLRHQALFAEADVDARTRRLNLVYLGGVAFLPYPTQVLGAYGDQPAAVTLYAITLAAVSAAGSLMAQDAAWWVAPAVVLAAIPASFVVGGWAPLVWLAVPLVTDAGRRWRSCRSRTATRWR